jgi:hypothetical protein
MWLFGFLAQSKIAIWIGGDWRYLIAHDGMRLWDRANGRDSIYTGGIWRSGPIIANPSGGTVVDSEARAALGAMLQYFRLIGILTPCAFASQKYGQYSDKMRVKATF